MWLMNNTRLPAAGGIKARVSVSNLAPSQDKQNLTLSVLQHFIAPPSKVPNGGPLAVAVAA